MNLEFLWRIEGDERVDGWMEGGEAKEEWGLGDGRIGMMCACAGGLRVGETDHYRQEGIIGATSSRTDAGETYRTG